MRRNDVAQLAGVPVDHVEESTYEDMFSAYMDIALAMVLAAPTGSSATYWCVGAQFYLDDPLFGPVISVDDLGYEDGRGLYDRLMTT
jgi:hypothetical protein